jgi:hypothetical protein
MGATSDPTVITWGTFAIAVYGVVQPWIVGGIRRARERREISIAETLRPEIFFSTPTGAGIGLYGTIFNKRKQTAVKTLLVKARRLATDETHHFEARIFRKSSFVNPTDGAFATPFMIEPDSAYAYNAVFHEPSVTRDFEAIYKNYSAGWMSLVRSKMPTGGAQLEEAAIRQFATQTWHAMQAGFPEFYMEAFNALNRMFFWRAGDWELIISVVVLDDNVSYARALRITLSPDEEKALLQNVSAILAGWSGQQNAAPYFAAPEYHT